MQAVDKKVKKLLANLSALPFLKEHYLAGGTNLALRYNHRTSIDLDFFAHRPMEQETSNLLNLELKRNFGETFESNSVTKVGVFGFIDKIKVDFVNYPYPLLHPVESIENGRLAHPIDIGGMKINAIVGRGSRKDFFDLHHLINLYPLEAIVQNYKEKYGLDNINQARIALGYFDDAEDVKLRDNKFNSFKDIPWKQIKLDIGKSLVDLDNAKIVRAAILFHNNTEYPGKVPNVNAFYPKGALSIAFDEKYGIKLSKDHLEQIDQDLEQLRDRGYGLSR